MYTRLRIMCYRLVLPSLSCSWIFVCRAHPGFSTVTNGEPISFDSVNLSARSRFFANLVPRVLISLIKSHSHCYEWLLVHLTETILKTPRLNGSGHSITIASLMARMCFERWGNRNRRLEGFALWRIPCLYFAKGPAQRGISRELRRPFAFDGGDH